MVWTLLFPSKSVDILIQDIVMNNWPTTADPDVLKLQMTRSQIDWGHDYDDQVSQRATIKATSMSADLTSDLRSFKKSEYRAEIQIRIQYRDVDNEQPRELWNMGKQLQTLIFQNSNALRTEGIHDMRNGDFEQEYKMTDIPEIHEWRQTVLAFFIVTGVNV